MQFRGEELSVLVAERAPHTLTSWSTALLASPPDHAAVRLFADVMVAFFEMVVAVAGDLQYVLVDLHWDNVGLTEEHAVVLIDCEGMHHGPTERPKDKYGKGVAAWIKSLQYVVTQHRTGAWGGES